MKGRAFAQWISNVCYDSYLNHASTNFVMLYLAYLVPYILQIQIILHRLFLSDKLFQSVRVKANNYEYAKLSFSCEYSQTYISKYTHFFVQTEHETIVYNQTSYKQMYIHLYTMKVILQMFAIILKRIEKVNLLCCFKMNPRKKVDVNFLSISSHCSIFEIRNNGIIR